MDKPVTRNEAARDFLVRKPAILTGNEWVEAGGGDTLPVFNPATGEQISIIGAGNADDVDHAVAAANGAFDSGVEINGGGPPDPNLPFGGYKQSGWGREHGREGLELYLQTKSFQITL